MSESKHTPGPWTAKSFHDGDPNYQYYEVSDLNGQRVAEVEGASKGQGHRHPRPPVREADANARLIAAAPDLLAVARMAANVKGALSKTLGAKAQAAIAKAKGGEE